MTNHKHWLLPEGIDEILPPEADSLERLRRELLDLYRSWGYELIFPPFIEYLDALLTGTGRDLDIETFKLTDQITGRTLGIRADITPQAARIDAHQLRRDCPTRLCYLGTALKTRSDDLGGSRSPLQIGAELYGHSGIEAELEIIRLMLESLDRAGLKGFCLDLGHVGIFRALARQAGLQADQELALFDALQRKAVPELNALVAGFGVAAEQAAMLVALAELSGGEALPAARRKLAAAGPEVAAALDDLERLDRRLKRLHPELPVHFDLAELRGYHYHTGPVFAAFIPGSGQEVARGGRYDDIGRVFGRARPACGFSANLNLLHRLGGHAAARPAAPAVFAPADNDPLLQQRIAALRSAGRRVIEALPGQQADAAAMGCGAQLQRQGDDWVPVPL